MKTEIKKRGRPATGQALTPAEKQRAYRDRQRTERFQMLTNPPMDEQLALQLEMNKKLVMSTSARNEIATNEIEKLKGFLECHVKTDASLRRQLMEAEEKIRILELHYFRLPKRYQTLDI